MASIFYKWFLAAALIMLFSNATVHPIYVSVVEIEHNTKSKSVEVSCKLFTDDFEKTLRSTYNKPVDLINPKDRLAMDKLINDYVQKHLKITADNKLLNLKYIGYEQLDEGIYSYYEAENINQVKKITVINNLLYEYKTEQMGLVHVTVNGNRKSTKLVNPTDKAELSF